MQFTKYDNYFGNILYNMITFRRESGRILVCVGAGIGNMLRVTPVITRLARHYHTKVDVFMNDSYKPVADIMFNRSFVYTVLTNQTDIAAQTYDYVFMTGCSGDEISQDLCGSARYISPRNEGFHFVNACLFMHEAQYNTLCLMYFRDGLDASLPKGDEFWVGEYVYHKPNNNPKIIGIHNAKGKNAEWVKKEYPHFGDVAELLKKNYEIHSLGLPHEYLIGSVNRTSTDINTTINNMLQCDLILSTDSGLLQIADSLGIPCIGLFGPTSIIKNKPLNKNSHIIQSKIDCAPCQYTKRQSECDKYRCMQTISAVDVIAKTKDFIINISS